MVYPVEVCGFAGGVDCSLLSAGGGGVGNIFLPGLRAVWLSAGVLSPGIVLARGNAAVEPVEQRRAAVHGAVEHADVVSAEPDLSAVSIVVVAGDVLSGPFISF